MTSILGGLNLIVSHYCSELSLSGSRCVSRLGSIVSRCFSSLNPFSRREIGPVEGEQRLYTPIARPDYSIKKVISAWLLGAGGILSLAAIGMVIAVMTRGTKIVWPITTSAVGFLALSSGLPMRLKARKQEQEAEEQYGRKQWEVIKKHKNTNEFSSSSGSPVIKPKGSLKKPRLQRSILESIPENN